MNARAANRNMIMTVSAAAVVILMLSVPIGSGYAAGYSASTVSENNTVTSSFITVGVYSYNSYSESTVSPIDCSGASYVVADNFTPVTMTTESSADIRYNGDKGTYPITAANLFFILSNTGFTDNSLVFKIRPYAVIDSVAASAYGANCVSVTLTGLTPDANGYYTIQPKYAYKVAASVSFSGYDGTSPMPGISSTVYLEGTVSGVTGIYCELRSIAVTTTGSETYQEIVNENGSTITTNAGTYNLVDGPTVNGNDSIIIAANSDNGIVSGNDGHVNVPLTIPAGKKFVVAFDYLNDNNKSQSFKLLIEEIISENNKTVIVNQYVTLDGNSPDGVTKLTKYRTSYNLTSSINNIQDSYWYQVTGEGANTHKILITISDQGNNSNKIKPDTVVYIVFKS